MKIVMLCDLYDVRAQYQENLLAKYYAKHGHEVTVIAGPYDSTREFVAHRQAPTSRRRDLRDGAVKVIKLRYSLNVVNRLRRFSGVAAILNDEKPDVIFVHDIHLNLPEAASYKRSHAACRLIMDFHADFSNSARNWMSLAILHKLIRRPILHRYLRYLDAVYAVVPKSAEFLQDVYGVAPERIELLPLGADTDAVRDAEDQQLGRAIRRRLGIPDEAITVFTGGKLTPLKETHVLVDAFLSLDNARLHLLVAGSGDGPDASYVANLRRMCLGNDRVHFVGWLDGADVYAHMNACDFAVFPASQSVLWQQALAVGLPLIVGEGSARGSQDSSYLNQCGNMVILRREQVRPALVAAEIGKLLADPELLASRQAGARRVGSGLLNYHRIVKQTLGGDK